MYLEFRILYPESKIQNLVSRIQYPDTSIQIPEPSIQILYLLSSIFCPEESSIQQYQESNI